jgi:hypothetical protein
MKNTHGPLGVKIVRILYTICAQMLYSRVQFYYLARIEGIYAIFCYIEKHIYNYANPYSDIIKFIIYNTIYFKEQNLFQIEE